MTYHAIVSALDDVDALIAACEPDDVPLLAGKLAQAQARVLARIASAPAAANQTWDNLLTAQEAAARYNVSVRWIRDNGDKFGARRLGHRCTRYPEKQLRRYLDKVRP